MLVKQNQLLAQYSTSRIGGRIRWVLFPESTSEIFTALRFCVFNRVPFFILGGGSNTIFEDRHLHYRQAVIHLGHMDNCQIIADQNSANPVDRSKLLMVDPGYKLQMLVDLAQASHLTGLTGLNRVPGTVGGAVIGNAGAYGTEIGDSVERVEYFDIDEAVLLLQKLTVTSTDGEAEAEAKNLADLPQSIKFQLPAEVQAKLLRQLTKSESQFGYRDSYFKQHGSLLITKVYLRLPTTTDPDRDRMQYDAIASKRDAIYPPGFVSPGSVFKNIRFENLQPAVRALIDPSWIVYGGKLPAGKLLEEIGSKGFSVGQMQMRPTHANILVNHGGGTFAQVQELIATLQQKVEDRFGIHLEPEIRLVPGDFTKFEH